VLLFIGPLRKVFIVTIMVLAYH